MDILYIVGKGSSKSNDFELRCSLRSIAQCRNVGRVYVVGHCPSWLSDEVTKIPLDDGGSRHKSMAHKCRNILYACQYAVGHSDIGEHFLVSMDDHFYLRKVDFDKYPYYVKRAYSPDGELPVSREGASDYTRYLCATREFLEEHGLPTKCFTLHRNMHCTRQWLNECAGLIKEILRNSIACEPWALLNNYAYSKGYITKYTLTDDCKVKAENFDNTKKKGLEVFSTYNFLPADDLYHRVEARYPVKCKYEK